MQFHKGLRGLAGCLIDAPKLHPAGSVRGFIVGILGLGDGRNAGGKADGTRRIKVDRFSVGIAPLDAREHTTTGDRDALGTTPSLKAIPPATLHWIEPGPVAVQAFAAIRSNAQPTVGQGLETRANLLACGEAPPLTIRGRSSGPCRTGNHPNKQSDVTVGFHRGTGFDWSDAASTGDLS